MTFLLSEVLKLLKVIKIKTNKTLGFGVRISPVFRIKCKALHSWALNRIPLSTHRLSLNGN